ncbi:MAG: hypothetical protein GY719_34115 [bacterium]|nr:hypothetical protein [bacterium]
MNKTESSPTMIIPSGTEIQIDVHGQLSVRTPGNLVIQNSGHYGEIESVGGSIRIESNAEVEAVSVRCAETCYVQGSLTSWKVQAKSIHLEERAQARIVLQETEGIEIGKNAHLVGNFSSEKELFLLFSRFAQQLRSLPFYFDRKGAPAPPQLAQSPPEGQEPPKSLPIEAEPRHVEVSPLSSRVLEAGEELPDQLFFALVLLEREAKNEAYGTTSIRVVEELVKLLKERDLDTMQHTYRTLFGRIVEPGDDVRRAYEMIGSYFKGSEAEGAAEGAAEA